MESSESDSEQHAPDLVGQFVPPADINLDFSKQCKELQKLAIQNVVACNTWLQIPEELMKPKKMCAVNQFVHIVNDSRPDDFAYFDEYVLVHFGPTIPDHFRWMVQCINHVNSASSIKDSFIPISGITKPVDVETWSAKGKSRKFDVVGLSRLVQEPTNCEKTYLEDFVATLKQQKSFRTHCNDILSTGQRACFARVSNVTMQWGFIPLEFENMSLQRKLVQVLRVIPQPGFNFVHFLRKNFFEKRNDSKHRDYSKIIETCNLLQQIVNYEADVNYGLKGTWDSSLPNPWMVEDPYNPTSVQRLLSPFTVLRRILQHIKGGYCGATKKNEESEFDQTSLIIDGFPFLTTAENAQSAVNFFEDLQEIYLKSLQVYEILFFKNLSLFHQNSAESFIMPSLLSDQGVNYNCLRTKLNMIFCLENFKDTDRICIPKLGMAMIDLFLFFEKSDLVNSMNTMDFVIAHVGELMATQIVTVSEIAKKYKLNSDLQSLEDFPRAGLHKSARDTFKRNAQKMIELSETKDQVSDKLAQYYLNYLKLQSTATKNGLVMDAWMSDRVYRSALLIEQLVGLKNPCDVVYHALKWAFNFRSQTDTTANMLACSPVAFTWFRFNLSLCKLNESVKANPMNLALIWGMLKGDVLTFMGMHNQTWRWMMYCMQIAPCWGHLRTVTEDGHAARSECTLTAKPNSVGLNEVVIKTTNYCLVDLLTYILNMTSEDMQALKLEKVDRKTRVSIESGHSCEFANNKLINKPSPSTLMQAAAIDEALRSFDESGLAGLINTGLPRDSNAGEGTTTKCLKPQNGYMEKGETRQLPGMGFYALIFATNTNARNATIAEMLRTLACGAMITYSPGCPDSPGLSTSLTTREKRKRGQQSKNSQCSGESMLPMDPEICTKLAYLISVSGILSRHLALVNKTGQSNWEISFPILQYMNMMQEQFLLHFSSWISANYVQSASRQFKGVIARGVAACLQMSVICNLEFQRNMEEANFHSLLQMENSALDLYWANIVLLNGFTHLLDSSIYIVNQLIKWKLRAPVLKLEFLCNFLDPDKQIDTESADFKNLQIFLNRLRNAKLRDAENIGNDPIKHFTGSYVQVEGIGNVASYNQVEKYLFQYCGINIGSTYTYLKMFRDAAHRSLDLSSLIDLSYSMMDIRIFFQRCNISYEDHWYTPPGGNYEKGVNYLILIEDKADIKGQTTVGTVWVHAVQLLFINSLLANSELHSDNSIKLGQEIFKLLFKRFSPNQMIPSKVLLCETFKTKYGEVVGDVFTINSNKQYIYRHRIDFNAWKHGLTKDACILQNHPLEDIIHLHAWIQVHYTLIGSFPKKFYHVHGAVSRLPELVPGRIYPTVASDGSRIVDGVLCCAPNGYSYVYHKVFYDDAEPKYDVMGLDLLPMLLSSMEVQPGPLICRDNAVMYKNGDLYLFKKRYVDMSLETIEMNVHLEDKFKYLMYPDVQHQQLYMCAKGEYMCETLKQVIDENGKLITQKETCFVNWVDAHECLLPLGTHMVIEFSTLEDKLLLLSLKHTIPLRTTGEKPRHVLGWLRYPDECDVGYGDDSKIFVAFRVATYSSDFDDVLILPFETYEVMLEDDSVNGSSVDYLQPRD